MSRKPFASGTIVPVKKSRDDIEVMLRNERATRIVTMDESVDATVAFMLAGRFIKIVVPIAGDATVQKRQEKWRVLRLVIKAKLEAVGQKISTVEQEFLPFVVLPDGQTVFDWIEPMLQVAYDKGIMPDGPLMLAGPHG